MAKLVSYIFISLCTIFLMSHNASAFSINQNVDVIQTINQPGIAYYDGTNWSSYFYGFRSFDNSSGNFTYIRARLVDFSAINEFSVGDYIILNGYVSINRAVFFDQTLMSNVGGFIGGNNTTANCPIVDLQFGAVQEYVQGNSSTDTTLWYRADFQLTCRISIKATNPTINFRIRPDVFYVAGTKLNLSFNTGSLATPVASDTEKEQAATQDAANNSQNSGNSSSSDASNASQSLISSISGFVSAITSASPSNCNINGNMGNLDIGNIDLCANPVPTYIQVISSLILICICIPFAIIMFNRFIALFRSFQ